jgi:hypothetical protein
MADVGLGDASRRRAGGPKGYDGCAHVLNNTLNICCVIYYLSTIDNGTYH